MTEFEIYTPVVRYVWRDGGEESYTPAGMQWRTLERAQASCFGSLAKRIRQGHRFSRAVLQVEKVGAGTVWGPVSIDLTGEVA